MEKLNEVLILLCIAAVVNSIQYDGLRVKFGWSDALADIEYFYQIPRTITEVESEGWQRTERPPGPLPELRMYCPPGRGVCPLYDTAGFVAGLQISIPVEEFESAVVKPDKKFVKWHATGVDGDPAREYWTATQYFVSEESLKAGAGPQVENGATLQDGGVWVTGQDGRLMRIPSTEAELNSTSFKKQNCVPNMGTHYYYNMTKNLNCNDLFPWFALVTQGDLVGTGFQVIGSLPKQKYRNWFEKIASPKQSVEFTIPYAPSCLSEWSAKHGVLSMHIYYVNEPWKIKCRSGDSIQLPAVMDRILLNGYRYANLVADEVSMWFKG